MTMLESQPKMTMLESQSKRFLRELCQGRITIGQIKITTRKISFRTWVNGSQDKMGLKSITGRNMHRFIFEQI